jgi:hypothetical protein
MAYIKCKGCGKSTNTWANYRHVHPNNTVNEWAVRAEGPTEDATPFPQPCPGCGTKVNAISLSCRSCGRTQPYPPQDS